MGLYARAAMRRKVLVVVAIAALTIAGSAAAFQAVPSGGQVNNDPTAGIDPLKGVSGEDPANSDVVGGALDATKPGVPWAAFRAHTTGKDQVFVRSFAAGAWTTRGNGTVGGSSDSGLTHLFSGSLNFDQTEDGEAPSIDFAGTGRTVPWASWYEHTTGTNFGADNIFASKFDNLPPPDLNKGKWIFAGQGRGNGGASGVPVPSLNIHTNRDAVNPVVAGGTTVAGNAPVPWVTWQEFDGGSPGPNQIFTSKAVKPASGTTCPNDPPGSANPIKPPAGTGANGGLCFQQVGIDRLAPGTGGIPVTTSDPSMNVDPSRDGVEPDMAFTGGNDTVPWVVWYEQNPSTVGLKGNELVFAAKATSNTSADGQFQWTAVAINDAQVLDTQGTTPSGSKHWGNCAISQIAEANCAINKDPNADAEDPRVAAGTMTSGNATVPWVVWDEGTAVSPNNNSVFVARLVGAGAAARFVIANGGQPVGTGDRADITFSANTPYVTWHHNSQVVTGHFTTPDSFVKDGADGSNSPDAVRAPISSSCIATPFNNDGQACQGGAIGTPFFLFTDGTSTLNLFARAYQSDTPTTGAASSVTTNSATIAGSVNPNGAGVNVSFDFGTTTAYGQSTTALKTGPDNTADLFSASLTGLPAGTTIHYRAVATSDFGTLVGADQTFTTGSPPSQNPPSQNPPSQTPGPGNASIGGVSVSGTAALVQAFCDGTSGATCTLVFTLTTKETVRGHKVLAVSQRAKKRKLTVTVGSASVTLAAGSSKTVKVSLNGRGKSLLARFHRMKVTLKVTQALSGVSGRTVAVKTITFKKKKKRH